MKKNTLTFLIVFFLFIVLNNLVPPNNTLSDSSTSCNSDEATATSTLNNKTTSKDNILCEDISTFNINVTKGPEVVAAFPSTETLHENLYSKLTSFLGDNINNVGLVYYNLSTKEYVTINENMDFDAASTYKVGLNLLYYYLANIGAINLSDTLTYFDYFYEDGTGILAGYCYNGMEIPIQELLDLSIIYSDNIATAMLSSYVGGYNAVREKLYSLLSIDYVLYENLITPAVSAEILKYVYANRDIPGFKHLIDTMKITVFHDRLDKYIPYNLVAHKIGSIDSYVHDIGFVFTDEPYIISIYTKGIYNADETIAGLSKIIYNEHTCNFIQFEINENIYDKY